PDDRRTRRGHPSAATSDRGTRSSRDLAAAAARARRLPACDPAYRAAPPIGSAQILRADGKRHVERLLRACPVDHDGHLVAGAVTSHRVADVLSLLHVLVADI